jgi:hypothetical protein
LPESSGLLPEFYLTFPVNICIARGEAFENFHRLMLADKDLLRFFPAKPCVYKGFGNGLKRLTLSSIYEDLSKTIVKAEEWKRLEPDARLICNLSGI